MDRCICSKEQIVSPESSLEALAAIRRSCPVLSEIFVDDQLWPCFEAWHRKGDTAARQRSILLLAMELGHLHEVTSPIHLIRAKGEISPQYQKDLREGWMLRRDPVERNKLYKRFMGRLIELKFAEWLNFEGWQISNLEALGGKADIEACSTEGHRVTFEVKFIGPDDADFKSVLRSLSGQSTVGWVSPYGAIDYLLVRIYEAAKQLEASSHDRVVSVILEDMTWFRVKPQLNGNWIDWEHPKFFSEEFCKGVLGKRKLEKYSDFPNNLQATLESLSAVRIFRLSEKFQFHEAEVGFARREHVGP